ncbi:hypothetical protein Tco_1394425 [Tanacetum coccineum]
MAPPPNPSRRRQKRMTIIRNEDAPRCTLWTNEEEIAWCKGWVHVSENSAKGNVRKTDGFWSEDSRAGDEDYFNKALVDYEAEFRVPFTLCHCWEIFKNSLKWWEQEVPRPMGRDKARGSKKKGAGSSGSSVNMTDEALATLMVSELATQTASAMAIKKEERVAYTEIKRREVECRERELEMQAYRQCQEDMRFYMQPYDHLTGDQLAHMKALRAEIKAKYNLPY